MGNGIEDSMKEAVLGVVVAAIFASLVLIAGSYAWLLYVVTFISSLALTIKLLKAEATYLIGWVVGILIIAQSGALSFFDLLIYIGTPILGLAIGIYLRFRE